MPDTSTDPFYPTDLTASADPAADPNYDPLADPAADPQGDNIFFPTLPATGDSAAGVGPLGTSTIGSPAALSALGGGQQARRSIFDLIDDPNVGSSSIFNNDLSTSAQPAFDPFAGPTEAAPAPAPPPRLPGFLGDWEQALPEGGQTAVNAAAENLAPSLGGLVGSGLGSRLGGLVGGAIAGAGTAAVVGAPEAEGLGLIPAAGAIIGGIAGMLAGQAATSAAQDQILTGLLGDDYNRWKSEVAAQQQANPEAAAAGSLLPQLIAFRPNPKALLTASQGAMRALSGDGLSALFKMTEDGTKIASTGAGLRKMPILTPEGSALWNVVFGGATQAGLSALQQVQQGQFQPAEFAISVLGGTILNHPNKLGRFLMGTPDVGENVPTEGTPPTAEGSPTTTNNTPLDPAKATLQIQAAALRNPAALAVQDALSPTGNLGIVGGILRRTLNGEGTGNGDIDYAFGGPEKQLVDSLKAASAKNPALSFVKTGDLFPVYRVIDSGAANATRPTAVPRTEVEVALHRSEDPNDTNKYVSGENVSSADDLGRRDFSINAMRLNVHNGEFVDPHGGLNDLRSGVLRTITPSSFKADPQRMLRALRFIGDGYRMDPATEQQMRSNARLLKDIPGERKMQAMEQILDSRDPGRALAVMGETGLLKHVFPGAEKAIGFDQKNPHHDSTLIDHQLNTVRAVKRLIENDPSRTAEEKKDLLMAAFLHDMGKLHTQKFLRPDDPNHASYKGHEDISAKLARKWLTELHYPTARIDKIVFLIKNHMFEQAQVLARPGRFTQKMMQGLSGLKAEEQVSQARRRTEDLMDLRQADRLAHRGEDDSHVAEMRAALGQPQATVATEKPAANGDEVMKYTGLKPGKELGVILDQLKDEVADGTLPNDKQSLLDRAKELAEGQAPKQETGAIETPMSEQRRSTIGEPLMSETRVVGEGGEVRAVAGMDPRMLQVLGGNLYNGDLGEVAIKEALQNSFDSVRGNAPSDRNIRVDIRTHGLTVIDNGHGMLPEVATKEFVDIGGSAKPEGASGGFGIAKVALFANAAQIHVRTVADDPFTDMRVVTTIDGSGADWLDPDKGLRVTTTEFTPQANDSRTTGTSLELEFNPDARVSIYKMQQYMEMLTENMHFPVNIDYSRNGEHVLYHGAPATNALTKGRTLSVAGAKIEIYTEPTQTEKTDVMRYTVLNNGIPQFEGTKYLAQPVDLPTKLIFNIKAEAGPETDNYPFRPDRQGLRGESSEAIHDYIQHDLINDALDRQREAIRNAFRDATKIPESNFRVVDLSGGMQKEDIQRVANAPYVVKFLSAARRSFNQMVGMNQATPILDGISLSHEHLGVNISASAIGRSENSVLLNPYITFHIVARGSQLELERVATPEDVDALVRDFQRYNGAGLAEFVARAKEMGFTADDIFSWGNGNGGGYKFENGDVSVLDLDKDAELSSGAWTDLARTSGKTEADLVLSNENLHDSLKSIYDSAPRWGDFASPGSEINQANVKAYWEELATGVARQTVATLLHEMAHQSARGHDESFSSVLTAMAGDHIETSYKATMQLAKLLKENDYEAIKQIARDTEYLSTRMGGNVVFKHAGVGHAAAGERPSGSEGTLEIRKGQGVGLEGDLPSGAEGERSQLAAGSESGSGESGVNTKAVEHYVKQIGVHHGIQQEATRNAEEERARSQAQQGSQDEHANQANQANDRAALTDQSSGSGVRGSERDATEVANAARTGPASGPTDATGGIAGNATGTTDATTGTAGAAGTNAADSGTGRATSFRATATGERWADAGADAGITGTGNAGDAAAPGDASGNTDGSSTARAGAVYPTSSRDAARDGAAAEASLIRAKRAEANATPADLASGRSNAFERGTAKAEQAAAARIAGRPASNDIVRDGVTVTGVAPRHEALVHQLFDKLAESGVNKDHLITKIEIVSAQQRGGASDQDLGKSSWSWKRPNTVRMNIDAIKSPYEIQAELDQLASKLYELNRLETQRDLTTPERIARDEAQKYLDIAHEWSQADWLHASFAHEYFHALAARNLDLEYYRNLNQAAADRGEISQQEANPDAGDVALALSKLPPAMLEAMRRNGMEGEVASVEHWGRAMDQWETDGRPPFEITEEYKAAQRQAVDSLMEYIGYDLQALDNTSPFPYNLATEKSYEQSFYNRTTREASQAATAAWDSERSAAVPDSQLHSGTGTSTGLRAAAADRIGHATTADQASLAPVLLDRVKDAAAKALYARTQEAAVLPRKPKENDDRYLQRVATAGGFKSAAHAADAINEVGMWAQPMALKGGRLEWVRNEFRYPQEPDTMAANLHPDFKEMFSAIDKAVAEAVRDEPTPLNPLGIDKDAQVADILGGTQAARIAAIDKRLAEMKSTGAAKGEAQQLRAERAKLVAAEAPAQTPQPAQAAKTTAKAVKAPVQKTVEEAVKAHTDAVEGTIKGRATDKVLKKQGVFDPVTAVEDIPAIEAEQGPTPPPAGAADGGTPPGTPPAATGGMSGDLPPGKPLLPPGMNPTTSKPYTDAEVQAMQARDTTSNFNIAFAAARNSGDPELASVANRFMEILMKLNDGYDFTLGADQPEEWVRNQVANIVAARQQGREIINNELRALIKSPEMNERIRKGMGDMESEELQQFLTTLNHQEAALANMLHGYTSYMGAMAQHEGVLREWLANYFPHLIEFDKGQKPGQRFRGGFSKSTQHAISRSGDDFMQVIDGEPKFYRDVTWKTAEALQQHLGTNGTVKTDVADVLGAHFEAMAETFLTHRLIRRMETDLEVPATRGYGARAIMDQTGSYYRSLPPEWRSQLVRGGSLMGSAGRLLEGKMVWKPVADRFERLASLQEMPGPIAKIARTVNWINNIFKEYKFLSPVHIMSMMSNMSTMASKFALTGLPSPADPSIYRMIYKGNKLAARGGAAYERKLRAGWSAPSVGGPEDMGPITSRLDMVPPLQLLHHITWQNVAYQGGLGLQDHITEQLLRQHNDNPALGRIEVSRDEHGHITGALDPAQEGALLNLEKTATMHAERAVGYVNNIDMTKDYRLYGGMLALALRWTTGQLRSLGAAAGVKPLANIGGGERFYAKQGTELEKFLQGRSVAMSRRLVLGGVVRLLATSILMGGAISFLTTGSPSTPIQNYLRDPAHTFDIYTGRDKTTNRDQWIHMPLFLFQREMTDWALAAVKAHAEGKSIEDQMKAPIAGFAGKINPITAQGFEQLTGFELGSWMRDYSNPDIDHDKTVLAIHKALDNAHIPDFPLENRLIFAFRSFSPAAGFPANNADITTPGQLAASLGPGTYNFTDPRNLAGWFGARTVAGTEFTTNSSGQEITVSQAVQESHAATAAKVSLVQAAMAQDWNKVEQIRSQLNLTHAQVAQLILHGVTHTDSTAPGILSQPAAQRTASTPAPVTVAGVKLTPAQEVQYEATTSKRQDAALQMVSSSPNFAGLSQSQKLAAYNAAIAWTVKVTNEQYGQMLGARPGSAITDAQANNMITSAFKIQQDVAAQTRNTTAYAQAAPEVQAAMIADRVNSVETAVWAQNFGNLKGATNSQIERMIQVQSGVKDGVMQIIPKLPSYKNATDIYQQQQVQSKALSYAASVVANALAGKLAGKGGTALSLDQILPTVENGLVLQDAALNMLHQSEIYNAADAKTQEQMDNSYTTLAHRVAALDTAYGVQDDTSILQQGFAKVLQSKLMADEGLQQLQSQYGGSAVLLAHQQELANLKARFAQDQNIPPSKISGYNTKITNWYYAQNPDYAAYIKAHALWISRNPVGQLYSALSKNELQYAINSPLNQFAPELSI